MTLVVVDKVIFGSKKVLCVSCIPERYFELLYYLILSRQVRQKSEGKKRNEQSISGR